ncbi:MAG: hypothetical protein NTV30_01630 [Chloroflexi bacterium]|jgi:hypothetical protein|nr:hypothetical protein [Chloroflexota bacterium]
MARQWRFKACPKCKGDVFIEKDMFGWYEQCLQCGHMRDLAVNEPKGKTLTAETAQGRAS